MEKGPKGYQMFGRKRFNVDFTIKILRKIHTYNETNLKTITITLLLLLSLLSITHNYHTVRETFSIFPVFCYPSCPWFGDFLIICNELRLWYFVKRYWDIFTINSLAIPDLYLSIDPNLVLLKFYVSVDTHINDNVK